MRRIGAAWWLGLAVLAAPMAGAEEVDPPEVTLGERLFLETRFAEFFARHAAGPNAPLPAGDPSVEATATTGAPLPGPFAGASINCRACHLVDEQLETDGGGMRTYGDFARRSPVPAREDGHLTTARNSPPLVNASLPRAGGLLLHFDGEFATTAALVRGTLTGRNYGWLPAQSGEAVAHIARVIREDDGSGALAQEFGGAYARVLAGTDPTLPESLRLPRRLRLDVARASDDAIVDAVSRLIAAYVEQLVFERDERGAFSGSPYDRFLAQNGLPRQPRRGESPARYSERLAQRVAALRSPVFVDEGPFAFHAQERVFGPLEFAGLRVFLAAAPRGRPLGAEELARGGIGNCASCHPAPAFTDFRFHNTGVSQRGYEALHGPESFFSLVVPGLAERRVDPLRWLPATPRHPGALEPLRALPDAAHPERADLGVWNVFANPDYPAPQAKLRRALCESTRGGCAGERLLERAFAAFKTPGLRDLSHSAPYMHDGAFDALPEVLAFYREFAALARAGKVRSPAPELSGIALGEDDVDAVVAFLRALNEDYE